jgi:hypothetical protein
MSGWSTTWPNTTRSHFSPPTIEKSWHCPNDTHSRSPPPPARRRHPLAQPKPIYNRPLPQAGARGASSPDNLAWFAQFVAAKALDSRVTAGVIAEKFAAHTSSIIRGSSTTPYSASRANLSCIILYRTLVLLGPNSSDYAKYFCTLSLSERTPVIRI